jgi:hypothetical protein
MGKSERLVTPFISAIIDEIICSVEDSIEMQISKHDRAREVVIYKDRKRIVKYETEDGLELALDDSLSLQAFSVIKKLTIVKGRAFHPSRGLSFSADLSLVLAQVNGKDEPILWQAANAFQVEKTHGYTLENTSNGNENITGRILEGTEIFFSPITIAKKYFPNQAEKVQKRQLDLTTLEFSYKMIVENVCTFCLERA